MRSDLAGDTKNASCANCAASVGDDADGGDAMSGVTDDVISAAYAVIGDLPRGDAAAAVDEDVGE